MMKKLLYSVIPLFFISGLAVLSAQSPKAPQVPAELDIWKKAYPGEAIEYTYNSTRQDWAVSIGTGDTKTILYWAGGRFLPAALLPRKENYRILLYRYPEKISDPAAFSPEEIESVRNFGNTENRRNAPVMCPAFFDAVYDSATQKAVERNIHTIDFLGRQTAVHKKIETPLKNVERKILQLAKTDTEVKNFTNTLSRTDGYLWRDIRDTTSRSFHSFGLAVDMLPAGWGQKILYWNWEKNKGNAKWMLIPLRDRWTPPLRVIQAFEEEGFIWGGKWGIWDNMHFEYRPELLAFQKK